MKEIINRIVKTTDNIGAYVGISGFVTRIIFLAIIGVLLLTIIALCVRHHKKKKAKAKLKTAEVESDIAPTIEKPVQTEEKVEAQPVKPEKSDNSFYLSIYS